MNPVKRAARVVIWMVAAGMIVIGGLNLSLEFIAYRLHKTEINVWHCLLWSMPVALGIVLLFAASSIARRLAEDSDDE